jgi:protoporphyrinogen/coproporphyrinogen III oxidase
MTEPRVAVVGGGIGGLAAARAIACAGDLDLTLFDGAERVGGVIRSVRRDGYLHEWAAASFLSAGDGATGLAEELGVEIEAAASAAQKRWIWIDDRLKAAPTGPLEAVRTDLVSLRGKLFALGEPLRPTRPGMDESVQAFVARRLGADFARLVGPVVTGIYAGDPAQLSVRAAFPRLAELEDHGGLVRGLLARARQGRRRRPRSRAPVRLCAPVEGVGALTEALASTLGTAVRTGARVARVEPLKNGRLRLRGDNLGRDGNRPFDAVVLAVAAPAAAQMVRDCAPAAAGALNRIAFCRAAVAYLGYRREDVPHPLDGFGFLVAANERLRMLGCVFDSVLFSRRAPPGHVLFRCIFGGVRDPAALSLSDQALIAAARADLEGAIGVVRPPRHAVVHRHDAAIAQYNLGHLDRVQTAEAGLAPLGITLAGSSYRGIAVNSCIADAARVARSVVARLAATAACLAVLGSGCGASAPEPHKAGAGRDGGDAGESVSALAQAPAGLAGDYQGGPVAESGTVEIRVLWVRPPAELLRSPGRNSCGQRRVAAIPVAPEAVIGDRYGAQRSVALAGAVVTVLDIRRGKKPERAQPIEMAVADCTLSPRVVRTQGILALVNDDEQRHTIALEQLGDGAQAPQPVATVALPVLGYRVHVGLDQPGLVRAVSAADPDDVAYAVVPAHPYVAVTDRQGEARLEQVPVGTYEIQVWYPPARPGATPRTQRINVEVAAGQVARHVVAIEG